MLMRAILSLSNDVVRNIYYWLEIYSLTLTKCQHTTEILEQRRQNLVPQLILERRHQQIFQINLEKNPKTKISPGKIPKISLIQKLPMLSMA